MGNTLEFEIPEGYEIDKEQSTNKKVVYKKVEKYEPKEGDLVVCTTADHSQAFIRLHGDDYEYSPSLMRGLSWFMDKTKWYFYEDSSWAYATIRPATAEETALFTRILAENGYEYDPEKKEVRKKRWRAGRGEPYLCVSEIGTVREVMEYNTWFDSFRHKSGNYFKLSERKETEEVAAKFREILSHRTK